MNSQADRESVNINNVTKLFNDVAMEILSKIFIAGASVNFIKNAITY